MINYEEIIKVTNKAKLKNTPNHIGFIMDGNGRWATAQNKPRTYGHEHGANKLTEIAIASNNLGVKAATFYAFSTENWKRPKKEVNFIFKLLTTLFKTHTKELNKHNIKMNFIGDLDKIPKAAKKAVLSAMKKTKDNDGLICTVAINYGARQDMITAVKKIKEDKIKTADINEALISTYLSTGTLPELDLIIRTSGEVRLSNFLLWEAAYAEMIFTKTYWPDFDAKQLVKELKAFEKRNIRKGGL